MDNNNRGARIEYICYELLALAATLLALAAILYCVAQCTEAGGKDINTGSGGKK